MRFYQKAGLFLLLVLSATGCSKSNSSSQVPNTFVDFTIYLTSPDYYKLNAIGGWVYYPAGVKGIIIYHQGVDQFMAYDRACTYMPSNANAIVHVDSTNIITVDTSCGSKFSLFDGSVLKGPAGFPLKAYYTSLNGSALRIYNQ